MHTLPEQRCVVLSMMRCWFHALLTKTDAAQQSLQAEHQVLGLHLPRTLKRRPMIIGSSSTWRLLDGMIARPRSTSDLRGI